MQEHWPRGHPAGHTEHLLQRHPHFPGLAAPWPAAAPGDREKRRSQAPPGPTESASLGCWNLPGEGAVLVPGQVRPRAEKHRPSCSEGRWPGTSLDLRPGAYSSFIPVPSPSASFSSSPTLPSPSHLQSRALVAPTPDWQALPSSGPSSLCRIHALLVLAPQHPYSPIRPQSSRVRG